MRRKIFEFVVLCILFGSVFFGLGQASASVLPFSQVPLGGGPLPHGRGSVLADTHKTPSNSWPSVVAQDEVGDCACGPCAIFNAFRFGNPSLAGLALTLPGDTSADKVRTLIALYGGKPSVVTPNQPRFLANGGMWEGDIVPFINDWLKDNGTAPVMGERLALQGGETGTAQMRRVYTELQHSLDEGFPPVVNLQSYSAHRSFWHHYWKWMDGHFVTVVGVQKSFSAGAEGFSMWVADSESGRVLRVYVHTGQTAALLSASDGRARRSGSTVDHSVPPYLMIQSPRLEDILAGADSQSNRTVCVLQYIVHR